MPGKEVKDYGQYHALRAQGYSKESAARITNAQQAKRKRRLRRRLKAAHRRAKKGG